MASGELKVEVLYSPGPGAVECITLQLPAGSTVQDAVLASGVLSKGEGLEIAALSVGVWGQLRAPAHPLRDRDRVEIYRPLRVDPMEARRQRQQSQRRKRAAG